MRPDSAPAVRPASSSSAAPAKKPKAKKPSAKAPPQAPSAGSAVRPSRVGDPTLVISNIEQLSEVQAKAQLGELQKKYGALIVNFNNQQAELATSQKRLAAAEQREQMQRGERGADGSDPVQEQLQSTLAVRLASGCCAALLHPNHPTHVLLRPPQRIARGLAATRPADPIWSSGLARMLSYPILLLLRPPRTHTTCFARQELRAAEAQNMQLQKKINKLQVEHVSEEEVDQLFYALELKEQQLAQVQRDKAGLEQEVMTARQMTARGTNYEPKFIEIHHNNLSDDDSDEDSDDDDEDDAKKG